MWTSLSSVCDFKNVLDTLKNGIDGCRGTAWVIAIFTLSTFRVWSWSVQDDVWGYKNWDKMSSDHTVLPNIARSLDVVQLESLPTLPLALQAISQQILQETPHLCGPLSCGVCVWWRAMGEPCQNLRWKKRGCWGLTTNQQAKIYRCRRDKKTSFSHHSIYSHSIHKYKQNKEDVHNNQLQPFTLLLTGTSHDLGPCRDRKRTIKRCLGTVAYTDLFPWVSLVGNLISFQFLIVYHKGAACSQWRTDRGKEAPAVLHDACCCISTDCSVFLKKLHVVLGGWWGWTQTMQWGQTVCQLFKDV